MPVISFKLFFDRELGLQEALWAQKKGDEKTVYNMLKSLQEEVESYK